MELITAVDIYKQIMSTRLVELRDDLFDVALRYARMRVDWLRADNEKQPQIGIDRTQCHNALIVACDVLSRNMAKNKEDSSWRKVLGEDRKQIGDWACYLHCILGLKAR